MTLLLIWQVLSTGGSSFGQAVTGLQPSAQNATIREGKLLNGQQTLESLKAWADSEQLTVDTPRHDFYTKARSALPDRAFRVP